MRYYSLPKEIRWLRDSDSPSLIGGRATDISQIGGSLKERLKEIFPINQCPDYLVSLIDQLIDDLERQEASIQKFIEIVSDEYIKVNLHGTKA